MIRHPSKVKRPGYDPERQLLAAVVLEAVRDCCSLRQVSDQDRASAEWFLSGEEGTAWLRAFGISDHKARTFVNKGYQFVS
jgi:hypothetical protein